MVSVGCRDALLVANVRVCLMFDWRGECKLGLLLLRGFGCLCFGL